MVGGEGGGGGKGAAARMTSVIKCVWESVRGHAVISGLHLLVAPSCSGSGGGGGGSSSASFTGSSSLFKGRDSSAEMVAIVEGIVRSVCHVEI